MYSVTGRGHGHEGVCVSPCREGEVRELERQVQEMRETVTQLQLERTELHTKVYMCSCQQCIYTTCTFMYSVYALHKLLCSQIEAGEGASTAISQLEQEKVRTCTHVHVCVCTCICVYDVTGCHSSGLLREVSR